MLIVEQLDSVAEYLLNLPYATDGASDKQFLKTCDWTARVLKRLAAHELTRNAVDRLKELDENERPAPNLTYDQAEAVIDQALGEAPKTPPVA
jgi:hypothetical protein